MHPACRFSRPQVVSWGASPRREESPLPIRTSSEHPRFSMLRLVYLSLLSLSQVAEADLAWLDFQQGASNPAPFHTAFPSSDGAVQQVGGLTFTLSGSGIATRDRGLSDPMLSDFAFIDGNNATIRLRISGLAAGSHTTESWHYDGGGFGGSIRIELLRVGNPAATLLLADHAFSTNAATVTFTADGSSEYELRFIENDINNRARLNGLRLRATGSAVWPPDTRFVNLDAANTTASGGSPDPFWTDDPLAAGYTSGSLWYRRSGSGFSIARAAGVPEVYEKNPGSGTGDAAPLVTTLTGLEPGKVYGVHTAFLSAPSESWRVRTRLPQGSLQLLTPVSPAGKITRLGPGDEPASGYNQYLGLVGNATADANGSISIHSDDGNGTTQETRTCLEGFALGAPVEVPSLPGGATEIAPDGAWTWFNDERAIVHRGSLFSGYVKRSGQYGITRHDPATGENHHMIVSTATSQQQDDHNNPSITPLPDGRLTILYSKHIAGSRFFQRTSLIPLPTTDADWGPEVIIPMPANNTYANTYRLTGESNAIYNFSRCINFNPTLSISTDLGASWGTPRQLVGTGSGNTRPYPRYCSNGKDRIDLIYTDGHPRDVNNSVYHMFYRGGTLRKTDDTLVDSLANIPLDHDGGKRGSVIYQYSDSPWGPSQGPDDWIPTGRGWTWDVHYGEDSHPVAVFQVQRDNVTGNGWNHDRIYYYYARWTGTGWQKRFIAQAGRGIYSSEDDYGGGMTLDPEDPRIVYISTNAASPFALTDTINVPLAPNERYEIWRGFTADGGLTFNWTPVTENSPADNFRPIVPANTGRSECLLWFHGTYTSYTNFSAKVLARLGEPAVTFRSWAETNAVSSDSEADDDGDGIGNLLEYALGSDPRKSSGRPLPTISQGSFNFTLAPGTRSLDRLVEVSENLEDWSDAALFREGTLPDLVSEGYTASTDPSGRIVVSPAPGSPETSRRFFRLRVINHAP
ncbi:MAG: hypothetical protein EOP88_02355 [Verrucomicrobiaceae bacterium]|nr:MAG: hypothetical protein EOP88_02355 [Verrucomicrobiaceae bacterium]